MTNILNAKYWEITVDLARPVFLPRVCVDSVAPYCNEITLSDLINTAQGTLIQIILVLLLQEDERQFALADILIGTYMSGRKPLDSCYDRSEETIVLLY